MILPCTAQAYLCEAACRARKVSWRLGVCRPAPAQSEEQPESGSQNIGEQASEMKKKAALRRFQRAARKAGQEAHPEANEVKDLQNRAGDPKLGM